MSDMDRRSLMVMAGLGVAAVAVPTPTAGAVPEAPEPPVPPQPGSSAGSVRAPDAAPPQVFGDEFNGPAGSAPDPARWSSRSAAN